MTRSTRLAALAILLAALAGAPARAHEIGTTRVTVVPGRETYQIEVVTDAASLAEKLGAVDGETPEAPVLAADLERLLRRHATAFRSRVSVRFDDVAATPAIAFRVTAPTDPMAAPTAADCA